jgi:hypothetical protein
VSMKNSVVVSSTGETPKIPALLTRMSGPPPNSAEIVRAACSTSAGLVTSHVTTTEPFSVFESSLSLVSLRASNATRTPSPASAVAIPAPIPREAPVTRALRPLRSVNRSVDNYSSLAPRFSTYPRPLCASRRNSSLVFGSSLNAPLKAEVMVREFCFCTPRIIMHR